MTPVSRETWSPARESYLARIRPWVEARQFRNSRHQKHPVHDFLFEYYEFRTSHLLRWTPGFGVELMGATRAEVLWPDFELSDNGLSLSAAAFPDHRVAYLKWAVEYLDVTLAREPAFGCMGMHEWAMVYRDPEIRHGTTPLRLSREETNAVVESQPLRCSHFDAYRFFSRAAVPLNRWELTRQATTEHDQAGCVHVNMDLYRFAYKIAPFCPSEILADAFEVAIRAREVDMRASPYDLLRFGLRPVEIETHEGRSEYVELQRELYDRSQPLREGLLGFYRRLLAEKSRAI